MHTAALKRTNLAQFYDAATAKEHDSVVYTRMPAFTVLVLLRVDFRQGTTCLTDGERSKTGNG